MSVSVRDRKSVIYSEVERLRDLLDQQSHRLCTQSEEIARLRAIAQPQAPATSERSAQPQAPTTSARSAQLKALKAFASKFNCTARLRDGAIELYSKKRSCWVTVPEGTQP